MIQFRAENEDQLCIVLNIRTSDTEPKIIEMDLDTRFRLIVILKVIAEIVRSLQNFYPVLLKSLGTLGAKKHRLSCP